MVHSGGTPEARDATLGPGTRLGKYEIVRLLGSGGMGAVYEGFHTEMGKQVAIKVLSPAVAAVPGARARFLREAQLTSRVRHPNIVDVTDMGSEGGQTFLVMELLNGEDLAQRLARGGPLPIQELTDIMLPICSAIVEAHRAGVTHRDLKPQNIFLSEGPHAVQPKILDFGISKGSDVASTGTLTATGAMIGTPFYLAPEQVMDARSAGPQSDQYALGVIMYECLTGERPYESENLFAVFQQIVSGQAKPLRRRRPDLPPALEGVVLRAMSVDAGSRFPSTHDLGKALLAFASGRARLIWDATFGPVDEALLVPPKPVDSRAATLVAPSSELSPALWGQGPVESGDLDDSRADSEGGGGMAMEAAGRPLRRGRPADSSATLPVRPPVSASTKMILFGVGVVGVAVISGLLVWRLQPASPPPEEPVPMRPRTTVPRSMPMPESAPAPATDEPVPGTPSPPSARTATDEPAPEPARGATPEPTPVPAPHTVVVTTEGNASAPTEIPAATTFRASVKVIPETAEIEFDGETVGTGSFARTLPVDHQRHTLRFRAEGYRDERVRFVDSPPPEVVKLRMGRSRSRAEPAGDFPDQDGERGGEPGGEPRAPRRVRQPLEPVRSLNPNGAPVID